MSSMLRATSFLILLASACVSSPGQCSNGAEWDQARLQNMQIVDTPMRQAIERWKLLIGSNRFNFNEYAGFLLTYPGFPQEEKLREYAEAALEREAPDTSTIVSFFEKFAPLTNQARARYALALAALRYPASRAPG